MEFQIPEGLKKQLAIYDTTTPRATTRVPVPAGPQRWTLGKLDNMIPYGIVSQKDQLDASARINMVGYPDRLVAWRHTIVTQGAELKAFMAWYESCWYAFWFAPKGTDYLYGLTIMMRDTVNCFDKVVTPHRNVCRPAKPYGCQRPNNPILDEQWQRRGFCRDDFTKIKIGRSGWVRLTVCVTLDDIKKGFTYQAWTPPQLNGGSSKNYKMNTVFREVDTILRRQFPTWKNAGLFERLNESTDTILWCLRKSGSSSSYTLPFDPLTPENFEHSVNQYIRMILNKLPSLEKILAKPAVRKKLQSVIDETTRIFESTKIITEDQDYRQVSYPINQFYHWCRWVSEILKIWPDCPIDHFMNAYDNLLNIAYINFNTNIASRQWLHENMPVASFFNILDQRVLKYYDRMREHNSLPAEERPRNVRFNKDTYRGTHEILFNELRDTINTLTSLIEAERPPAKPKRWRIMEFHDHVVAEAWKIRHKNYDLPQDIFPSPFKIEFEGRKWCVMQPIDAHQLAQWGQAARNCVGSAGYGDQVRRKECFIFMIMVDSKPRFTAQLRVRNGILKVGEIKDVANKALNSEQKVEVEFVLKQGLAHADGLINPIDPEPEKS